MKNYNNKIQDYLKWLESGENGDIRFSLPSRDSFDLYRMENPNIPELTEDEGKYLDILYKVTLLNKAAIGAIKPDVAKLILGNDYGYIDKPKQKDDSLPDYVTFDTTGLAKDCTTNHNDESLENEAIKELNNGK